jgi:hypothetical protein
MNQKLNDGKLLNNELKNSLASLILDPTNVYQRYENFKNIYELLEKEYLSYKAIHDDLKVNVSNYVYDYMEILKTIVVPKNTEENFGILNTYITQGLKLHDVKQSVKTIDLDLAPSIKVRVIPVKNESLVPETPIYYLEDSKEFAVNIQGTIFKGNIRDILPPKIKQTSPDQIKSSSYLYMPNVTNDNVRKIGNKKNLYNEILSSTSKERMVRKIQCIQDILTCVAISQLNI